MAIEIIKYRGYDIEINPHGSGLKVMIRATGGAFTRPEIAHSPDKSRREELIAEAKATVDALLDHPHEKKPVR